MPRTVSVKLVAEIASYMSGLKEAEKSTTTLEDKVKELGATSGLASVATDHLGNNFKDAAHGARSLQGEIKQLDRDLAELAIAYAAADTAANRSEIFNSVKRKRAERRKLTTVDDLLPDPAEIEAAGKKAGKSLGASVSEALSEAPIWAPAAVALAPMLGAVASAAVIGGAGIGGVVGGVILASKDPRVAAAGKALGENLLGQLQQDAAPFVEPVLQNIGKIEVAFHGMNGQLERIFQNSSQFVNPLVNGVLDGVHGLVDGIDKTVSKAGPVVDAVGRSFATLGTSAGKSLSIIAGGSSSAARGLDDLSGKAGDFIVGIGAVVRALTEVYGIINYLPDKGIAAWERYKFGIDEATAKMSVSTTVAGTFAAVQQKVAAKTLSAAEAAGSAGLNMQTYASALDEAASKGRGLYDSQTAVAQAIADTKSALDKNGHSLSLNTEKGRQNRSTLSSLAGALVANYDAYVKVNGEGAAAAGVASRNRVEFVKLARQFGLGSRAANDLADSMGLIKPKSVDVHVNTHDAIGRANAARDALNAIHGKTVSVHVSVTGLERLDQAGHRIGGFRAAGGPVKAGNAYVVGEHQAEVFVPNQDGRIIPSISQYAASASAAYGGDGASYQSMPMWQTAGTGGGNTIVISPTFAGPVGSRMELQTWLEGSVNDLKRKGKL